MLRRLLISAALLGGSLQSAVAQGWIEPARPLPGGGVERLRGAVHVQVQGRVARVTVEEWFRNAGVGLAEGVYHYPMPGEAVFSSFSLWQGDQELRGETMDAAQARTIYEDIVRRRRDPALIELAQHGLLRARVFPIGPGETRKITLRYTQLLDRTGDAWRFRYLAGLADRTPRTFLLEADSATRFGEPYSPTHRITPRRADGRLTVTLADSAGSGDLELLLPLARGLVGLSLVTERPDGEDGYFMLLLAPGMAAERAALRRDVVAVVDVSGSMAGDKLEQVKTAVGQLLGTLRTGDRFRLVAFSSHIRRFAEQWTALTPETRRDAAQWAASLNAEGGTNISGALAEALSAPPAAGALGVVVFLTDGLPTAGETDPERLADRAERDRGAFRVFAVGVGHDVNTYVLDRLTVRARGTTEYVPPGGDLERAVGTLAAKLSNPVLTDLALTAPGAEVYQVEPGELPDLFAGDELVVFGRYRTRRSAPLAITVTGRRGGQVERFATAAATGGAAYVPPLWASRRAGTLAREIRLRGPSQELVDALKTLALRHGILTEYTAYLVQEPTVVAAGGRDDRLSIVRNEAPRPPASVGAGAVRRSAQEAKAAGVAVAADAVELDAALRARSGIAPTTRAGGRLFILRDSVWTDLRYTDSLRVVTVAPFSPAYFALLRALPELVPAAQLDRPVVVAGAGLSIKIVGGGKTAWDDGELAGIIRRFRGT